MYKVKLILTELLHVKLHLCLERQSCARAVKRERGKRVVVWFKCSFQIPNSVIRNSHVLCYFHLTASTNRCTRVKHHAVKTAHRADPAATPRASSAWSFVLVPFQRHARAAFGLGTSTGREKMRPSAARARARLPAALRAARDLELVELFHCQSKVASRGHRRETPPGILDRSTDRGSRHTCTGTRPGFAGQNPKLSLRLRPCLVGIGEKNTFLKKR